jgi:ATP-dependent RNA helicase RhlB
MQFSQFSLDPSLQRGLDAVKYMECTPVQEATLKAVLENSKDVYAQSQTGTGKTAAFLVAAFSQLLKPEHADKFALILAPTRELVVQIEKEAASLNQFLRFNLASIYGGVSYDRQIAAVKRNPRIVVATPGRLLDFANQNLINLKNATVLVIDEADRLFDMGFHKDVLRIVQHMPRKEERLNLLFSATLNPKVGQLAWEHMNNPESIVIKSSSPMVEGIVQRLFHVGRSEKMILLLSLIKKENPSSAIIFSNTKSGAGQVAKRLRAAGFSCGLIEGNIPQKKRLQIIADMKLGRFKFLAATDVASRGIHIPNLDLVINFDLPDDAENYIHRIGRTARGEQTTGKAISFACERFVYNLAPIERLIKRKIPLAIVDDELQAVVNETLKEEAARPQPVRPPRADDDRRPQRDHPRRDASGPKPRSQGGRTRKDNAESDTPFERPRRPRGQADRPPREGNSERTPRPPREHSDRPREGREHSSRPREGGREHSSRPREGARENSSRPREGARENSSRPREGARENSSRPHHGVKPAPAKSEARPPRQPPIAHAKKPPKMFNFLSKFLKKED